MYIYICEIYIIWCVYIYYDIYHIYTYDIYIYIIWYISYIYIHMIYVFSNMMYDLYMCFIGFFKNEGYWSTTSHIFRTAAARGTSDGGRQSTCSSSSELCAAWKTQWLPVVFSVSFPSKNGGHIYILLQVLYNVCIYIWCTQLCIIYKYICICLCICICIYSFHGCTQLFIYYIWYMYICTCIYCVYIYVI
jgi:hypothetical protein